MKKPIRSIVVIAGMASTLIFASQFAQARGWKECCNHSMDQKCQHKFEKMTTGLGLSEQQQTKIKEIFKQEREKRTTAYTGLRAEKKNLSSLVHADKTDEAAIRAQASKIGGIEGDIAVQRSRTLNQISAILTPEQAQKFKSLQKERDCRIEKSRKHSGKRSE